jgi:hypothetical protein
MKKLSIPRWELNFKNAIAIQEQEGFKFTKKELKFFKHFFKPEVTIEEIEKAEDQTLKAFQ